MACNCLQAETATLGEAKCWLVGGHAAEMC